MRALRREAPLLLLLLYGGAFAYAAFGRGVPAFDDHPGQLFRLWHALERSLPSAAWTADWNPDWWGGYPELQFYPPGLALVGAALRAVLLWQPSVETVYRLLCAVVFLAPGVTTYALLVRVLGDRWLALPGAFLALTLSADLRGGVEAGLRWGTLTTRLGLAWLPLLALALRPWVEGGRIPRWAPPLAALAILSHPSTLPVGGGPRRPRRRPLAAGQTRAADHLAGWCDGGPHPRPDGVLEPAVRRPARLGGAPRVGRPLSRAPRGPSGAAGAAGPRHDGADGLDRGRDPAATLRRAARGAAARARGHLPRRRVALPARLARDRASAPPRRDRAGLGLGGRARRRRHRRPGHPRPGRPSEPTPPRAAGDRGGGPPARPRRAPADADRLARGGRVADARRGVAPPSARPALERASRQDGPRPLPHVVPQARRQSGVVRPPQPRHQPGAPPGRPRNRERNVHASVAPGRAVLHRPGDAACPASDPRRAPRRPAPARRAVGSALGGELRPVRPKAPHRHRRRPDGPRSAGTLPRPRVRAGRRRGGLHPLRAARPPLAARRADHVPALPRPPLADGRRVDPHRHRGLPALAGQERHGPARDPGGRLGAPRVPRAGRPLRGGARLHRGLARVDRPGAVRRRGGRLARVGPCAGGRRRRRVRRGGRS